MLEDSLRQDHATHLFQHADFPDLQFKSGNQHNDTAKSIGIRY